MTRLLLFFLPDLLRVSGLSLGGCLLALFVGHKFGADAETLALPGNILLILGFTGGAVFQRNTSWIKSLPVSRLGVLLGGFVCALLQWGLMMAGYGVYRRAFRVLFPSSIEGFDSLGRLLGEIQSGGSVGIQMLWFLVAVFLATSFSPFVNRAKSSQWFEAIPAKWKAIYLGITVIAGVIALQSGSFFVVGLLLIAGLNGFAISSIDRDLALYPSARKLLRMITAAFICVQGLVVYSLAHREIQSGSLQEALNAQALLGSLALPIPEERLLTFFNEAKDPEVVLKMVVSNPKILNLVNVEVWLKSKGDPRLVLAVEEKIDPSDWSKDRMMELFQKYEELKLPPRIPFYMKMLRSKVAPEEAKDLVSSGNRHAALYGILLCRRYLEPSCVPAILDLLKTLPEQESFQALILQEGLRTLSAQKGAHLSFEFYSDLRTEKFKPIDWADAAFTCKEFALKSMEIEHLDEVAKWNHCIRLSAMKAPLDHPFRKTVAWWGSGELKKRLKEVKEFVSQY